MDFEEFKTKIIDSVCNFRNNGRNTLISDTTFTEIFDKCRAAFKRCKTEEELMRLLFKYEVPYWTEKFMFPIYPLSNKECVRDIQDFLIFKSDMLTCANVYFEDKAEEDEEVDVESPIFYIELDNCKSKREVLRLFRQEGISKTYFDHL